MMKRFSGSEAVLKVVLVIAALVNGSKIPKVLATPGLSKWSLEFIVQDGASQHDFLNPLGFHMVVIAIKHMRTMICFVTIVKIAMAQGGEDALSVAASTFGDRFTGAGFVGPVLLITGRSADLTINGCTSAADDLFETPHNQTSHR